MSQPATLFVPTRGNWNRQTIRRTLTALGMRPPPPFLTDPSISSVAPTDDTIEVLPRGQARQRARNLQRQTREAIEMERQRIDMIREMKDQIRYRVGKAIRKWLRTPGEEMYPGAGEHIVIRAGNNLVSFGQTLTKALNNLYSWIRTYDTEADPSIPFEPSETDREDFVRQSRETFIKDLDEELVERGERLPTITETDEPEEEGSGYARARGRGKTRRLIRERLLDRNNRTYFRE